MVQLLQPYQTQLDFDTGVFETTAPIIRRFLNDMRNMYADQEAVKRILDHNGDRLIYEVYPSNEPEDEGQVLYCTTIIYPGQVGDEYHMTKGHFHSKPDRAEVYLGLSGEGYLLLMTEDGEFHSESMKPGTLTYVPPHWAHRTVNTGTTPFIFFAVWPGDAGHNYGSIEKTGFSQLLVKHDDKPQLVMNPRYET